MMKKVLLLPIRFCAVAYAGFAATTWDNNEFQRKSRSLSLQAEEAYDEGDYDAAVEYAREAEENARLSAEYIEKMLARADAEKKLLEARTRYAWAEQTNADRYFPAAMKEASAYISQAEGSFADEDWTGTQSAAEKALQALSSVREIVPLPSQYIVDKWDATRDCFWNIAKNPAIYGDPFMWEKLYEANRKALKRPGNPHLIMPGMTVEIPSIEGEYREGIYDPGVEYEPFKKNDE